MDRGSSQLGSIPGHGSSQDNAGDQPVREKEIEMKNDKTENSVASHGYASIDLVVRESPVGKYQATGGPEEAVFCGTGVSSDEAIGSWFRQNREAVNFQVSFVGSDGFKASTRNGSGRTRDQLGPNEAAALDEWQRGTAACPGCFLLNPKECPRKGTHWNGECALCSS